MPAKPTFMPLLHGAVLSLLVLAGCKATGQPAQATPTTAPIAAQETQFPVPPPPVDGIPVIANLKPDGSFAHNPQDFTQGLLYADGALYESTGRTGESKVRRLNAKTGEVEETREIAPEHFGEGLASFQGSLYQLTWTSQVCLVYDRATLKQQSQLFYTNEGWGLTISPEEKLLVFSDGSPSLRFLDPSNFISKRQVSVTDGKTQPVDNLNELEWVRGEVWANVWLTDRIARIDPKTGKVIGWVLFTDLMAENHKGTEDVLNGIAYDPASDTMWITGKLWPTMYRFDNVKDKFFKAPTPTASPHA